jgi:hypothetical protein
MAMDANKVTTFCTLASDLLAQLTAYAALEPAKRSAEDDAQVRQLRVASSALNMALETLARISPMPMPPPPPSALSAPTSSAKP